MPTKETAGADCAFFKGATRAPFFGSQFRTGLIHHETSLPNLPLDYRRFFGDFSRARPGERANGIRADGYTRSGARYSGSVGFAVGEVTRERYGV